MNSGGRRDIRLHSGDGCCGQRRPHASSSMHGRGPAWLVPHWAGDCSSCWLPADLWGRVALSEATSCHHTSPEESRANDGGGSSTLTDLSAHIVPGRQEAAPATAVTGTWAAMVSAPTSLLPHQHLPPPLQAALSQPLLQGGPRIALSLATEPGFLCSLGQLRGGRRHRPVWQCASGTTADSAV